MENQHRMIKGYRDLTQDEIDVMNAIKETAKVVGELVSTLQEVQGMEGGPDPRWLQIGKTDLQKGFMALTRAIAKPEFF